MRSLPFENLPERIRDTVCIVPRGVGNKERDFVAVVDTLAKQAGLDVEFSFADQCLPDAPLYILPSVFNTDLDRGFSVVDYTLNTELAKRVEPLEQVVDRLKRKIKRGHISRLRQGDCTMELGFILSDLLTNLGRISDHCSNIAACLIEMSHDSLETHEYLNNLKSGAVEEFSKMYEEYKAKYYIA